MKEQIMSRLEELVGQINVLIDEQEQLSNRAKRVRDLIIGKQAAIFELKGLLEPKDE